MTFKTRLSVLMLSTPALLFVVVGGLMGNVATSRGDETFQHLRVFDDVVNLVVGNYVEEVKVDRVMEGALKGLAEGLDPDSAYLNPQQVADVQAGAALPSNVTPNPRIKKIIAANGSKCTLGCTPGKNPLPKSPPRIFSAAAAAA